MKDTGCLRESCTKTISTQLIFDRNFVCDIHFRVTRNKMQMLRFWEALIAGMVTKQNKEENLPTTSCSSTSVAGRNSKKKTSVIEI